MACGPRHQNSLAPGITEIGRLAATEDLTIAFFREHGILKDGCQCETCDRIMHCVLKREGKNGEIYKCGKCRRKKTIRYRSICEGSHLPMSTILLLIHSFAVDMQVFECLKLHPSLNKRTVIKWYRKFRGICSITLRRESIKLGGSISGNIVEIDESLFGKKVKYHKGRAPKEPIWVFGAAEKGSRCIILKTILRRNRETLLPIIKCNIVPGSTIHSDEWAAYASLADEGYIHQRVNHSEEFRSDSGCCTNTIEGIWSLAKLRIKKMKGVLPDRIQDFLDEFCYRYRYGQSNGDIFWRFLDDIKSYGHMLSDESD